MRISLVVLFAIVVVASSKGLTLRKFQQTLLKIYDSPFVSLMLIYDSSTEGIDHFIISWPAVRTSCRSDREKQERILLDISDRLQHRRSRLH